MQLTLFTWIVRKDKHIMGAFSGFANSVLTMTASGKHIIANAGTAIAGRIFGKAGFERFNSLPTELAYPANVYQLSDCIKAEVTSMCCGDPSFEGICDIRSDESYDWLDHAKKYTLPENISNPREGKTVYIGSTWIERSYRNASGNTRRPVRPGCLQKTGHPRTKDQNFRSRIHI